MNVQADLKVSYDTRKGILNLKLACEGPENTIYLSKGLALTLITAIGEELEKATGEVQVEEDGRWTTISYRNDLSNES